MPRTVKTQNSKTSHASKLSKTPKVQITKATEEQIKKAPQITIDSDTESEPHYLEEVINNFIDIDFESKYRETLFNYNALKEEHQGAKEEINGLKDRLKDSKEEIESIEEQRDEARQKALELFEIAKRKDEEIQQFKGFSEYAFNTCQEERENVLKMENEKTEVIREKITIINSLKFQLQKATADALKLNDTVKNLQKERDNLRFKNDGLQLTNDNLNTELKDLKIYADDNEKNFFKISEENKELEDTITGLELEKEIICKQNEELSEKVKYFRQETLNQVGKRKKETDEKDKIIQELKRKLSDVDIERCNYKSELGCIRRDFKEITTLKENFERELNDIKKELKVNYNYF